MNYQDVLHLICFPILFAIGTFISLKKELIGSLIMLSSILIFNLLSWYFLNTVKDFDFIILFLGSLILFIKSIVTKNNNQ